MIIGSTNSLTYQSPRTWWNKILGWHTKHQEVDHEIQYMFYGVRLFNLKLYVNENNRIVIRSGHVTYPIFSLYEILDYFNKKGDVTVLVTLDETFEEHIYDNNGRLEKKFKESCRVIETIYKNIIFCGGYREFDKKVVYEFKWEKKNGMPKIIAPDEWSKPYKFVQKWLPFLIKKFNKMYIKKFYGFNGFLMLSYVNRR